MSKPIDVDEVPNALLLEFKKLPGDLILMLWYEFAAKDLILERHVSRVWITSTLRNPTRNT
ncbi:MAG: hypothetical protein IPO48_09120 [Saprospiraceae bacterium]|nr:hypothetical protein [Saprospiraceae bacterium]